MSKHFKIMIELLRTEDQIISSWDTTSKTPKVSICCITYNHEHFIENALQSFLMQETNFPIEIIIHDDASTDSTQKIIQHYKEKYPKIIKIILQTENQYSKGIKPSMLAWPQCQGQYIAICEGDDYWTDPNKISIQVDYLDKHPDIIISSHDAQIIDENNKIISSSKLPNDQKRDFSQSDLMLSHAWLLTMNWVFRNNIDFSNIPEYQKVLNGDTFLLSYMGKFGGSHHHTDIKKSVYRVHAGGIWSSLNTSEKNEAHMNTYFWIYKYYKRTGNKNLKLHYKNKFTRLILNEVSTTKLIKLIIKRLLRIK